MLQGSWWKIFSSYSSGAIWFWHKFHPISRPILFFIFFRGRWKLQEAWSSTSLIRNVSARLRPSNHMLPTDFPQSRAHPRATYRGIFPLLLLLSRLPRYSKRGLFVPTRAVVPIFRNSNKNTADAMSYRNDRIRYRKRKNARAQKFAIITLFNRRQKYE